MRRSRSASNSAGSSTIAPRATLISGDDQPGGRALGVVFDRERARHVAGGGAVAGHRRHDDAVGQRQRADCNRREEVWGDHRWFSGSP
jgi:hypothetical protein